MPNSQIKLLQSVLFMTLLAYSGYSQEKTRKFDLELNFGTNASSNLKSLESASIGPCCFDFVYQNEKSALGLNYSIGLGYKTSERGSVKFGIGLLRTRRAVSVAGTGGIIYTPPVFSNQHTVLESFFLSLGYEYAIPIKHGLDFTIENGLAAHWSSDHLTTSYLFAKTYFFNYNLKFGPRFQFMRDWSITPQIVLDGALIAQDVDDRYQPLSTGLEISIAYKL